MNTKNVIADLVTRAMRSKMIGLTVADRVKLISGTQRNKVRLILLRSIRKGETPDAIVSKVKAFYEGVKGNGGPSYMARRLVQSEITRFNARVAVRMGELINQDTGRIPIYTYRTQLDDRVRDTHAEQEGVEFTADEYADQLGLPPVSEAEDLMSEPNCRCWLDVSYEGASGKGATGKGTQKVTDTSPPRKASAPSPDNRQRLISAVQSGDRNAVLAAVTDILNSG